MLWNEARAIGRKLTEVRSRAVDFAGSKTGRIVCRVDRRLLDNTYFQVKREDGIRTDVDLEIKGKRRH